MSDWIPIGIPFGRSFGIGALDEHGRGKLVELDSFVARRLNKPGTLIRLTDGSEYLIGHSNESGGSCDCCAVISNDDIVTHYRVVWSEYSEI